MGGAVPLRLLYAFMECTVRTLALPSSLIPGVYICAFFGSGLNPTRPKTLGNVTLL